MIGVVMQDDQLFAGSIADNICFFARARLPASSDAPGRRRCTKTSSPCPCATTRWSATWAPCCRAARSSASCCAGALPRAQHPGAGRGHQPPGRGARAHRQRSGAWTQLTRILVAHRPETIASADRAIDLDEICGRGVVLSALSGAGLAAVGHHAGPAAQLRFIMINDAARWIVWDRFVEATPDAGLVRRGRGRASALAPVPSTSRSPSRTATR